MSKTGSQMTIDSWISPDAKFKRYFFLDWSNRFRPSEDAVFLTELTEEQEKSITFKEVISWRNIGQSIVLCGNIYHFKEQGYKQKDEEYYSNAAFLKSHLQKCIRRKDADKATKTAFHFMRLDMQQFLRRLPIIMVEDTFLHTSFTTILWLCCAHATDNFELAQNHIEYLLGIVYLLSSCKYQDFHTILNSHHQGHKKYDFLGKIPHIHKNLKSDVEVSLLYALQFRKAYGGMRGDMNMLNELTDVWYDRFIYNHAFGDMECVIELYNDFPTLSLTKNKDMKEFVIDDWITEGIDFHCAPDIIQLLRRALDEKENRNVAIDTDPDALRNAMWYYSSSINKHKIYEDTLNKNDHELEQYEQRRKKYKPLWDYMRRDYYKIAKYILWKNR